MYIFVFLNSKNITSFVKKEVMNNSFVYNYIHTASNL